jgi:hypoxanthine-DNA glycosylase
VAACVRPGSLDSAIEAVVPNDPQVLLQHAPGLRRALFNGSFAQAHMPAWSAHGIEVRAVPSSSPANATHSFDTKLALWRAALS